MTSLTRMVPGSSVQGILQARILEWVALSSSRDLLTGNLPDPGMDQGLHCRQILYHLSHQGSPSHPSQDLYQIATLMLVDSEQDQVFGANELTGLRKESPKTRK